MDIPTCLDADDGDIIRYMLSCSGPASSQTAALRYKTEGAAKGQNSGIVNGPATTKGLW